MKLGKKDRNDKKQEWNEEAVEKRRTAFAIWNLKRMKTAEILMKICAAIWAIVWSVASIVCFFSEHFKPLTPLVMLPAAGFWVLLARASGSVRELDHEIQEISNKKAGHDRKRKNYEAEKQDGIPGEKDIHTN